MPLPASNPRYAYQAFMHTGGPIKEKRYDEGGGDTEDLRNHIADILRSCYGANLRAFTIALEESAEGYKHFHAALDFHRPQKPKVKVKNLLIDQHVIGEDDQGRKPNMSTHNVRQGEVTQATAYLTLCQYLVNPSKIKQTDDNALDYVDPTPLCFTTADRYSEWLRNPPGNDLAARLERFERYMNSIRWGVRAQFPKVVPPG